MHDHVKVVVVVVVVVVAAAAAAEVFWHPLALLPIWSP